jgi:hypothetical protein
MYGLTFTYIDDDTDLVTLGARAWKSRRGQLKHWHAIPAAPSRTRFLLERHGLDAVEEREYVTAEIIETLMSEPVATLIENGWRNACLVNGHLTGTRERKKPKPVTADEKKRIAIEKLNRLLQLGLAEFRQRDR